MNTPSNAKMNILQANYWNVLAFKADALVWETDDWM